MGRRVGGVSVQGISGEERRDLEGGGREGRGGADEGEMRGGGRGR